MEHTVTFKPRLSARRLPQGLARIASAVSLAMVGLSLSLAAHAQSGPKTIEGNFTHARNTPDWTLSGSRFGSPHLPTMDGSGWLHLAGGKDSMLGQVEANAKLPSGVPIRVEFDYAIWGGDFDGLTVYFADANAASAGRGGEAGGGLGYCGMNGAFLGIGIDEGGNFAQQHCGIERFGLPGAQEGMAVTGPGVRSNSVTVRGPQTEKYPYIISASLNDAQEVCITCTDRSQAGGKGLRRVVLDMTPRASAGPGYVLNMTVNGREVLKNLDYPYAVPSELVMGLAATTGSYGAHHEIRNLKLSVEGGVTPPVHCLTGVGPDGKCPSVVGGAGDWDIGMNIGSYHNGRTRNEWVDGDLAQKGWDGKSAWSDTDPELLPGDCMQMGLVSNVEEGIEVDQIAFVSRQDDWQNAVAPTRDMKFTRHGAVDIKVSYTKKGSNRLILAGEVKGNDKVVWSVDLLGAEMVSSLYIDICKTADGKTSPLAEILAFKKK